MSRQKATLLPKALGLHRAGNLEAAASVYRDILATEPHNAEALRMLGVLQLQRGAWREAEQSARAYLKFHPDQDDTRNNLGYALQNLGRDDEALSNYDAALSLNPSHAGAWYNRGNLLHKLQRYDDAEASYRKALALRPNHADTWINLGNTLKQMRRYEEALACYDKALTLAPQHAMAHNNRGNTLKELKRYEEALASFGQALRINPRYADACFNAGIVLEEMKRYEEALQAYRQTLALDPGHAQACLNRGTVLIELARITLDPATHSAALASFDQAIALKPDYADAYVHKGGLLIELGRMSEAEALLNKALELEPDNPEALSALVPLKRARQDDPRFGQLEAIYARRTSLAEDKQIPLDFAMGKALENVGRYDEAFAAYAEGNRLHRAEHPYDEAEQVRAIETTRNFFSRELFRECAALKPGLPPVHDERVPVFIVGMPRSGTTLIEQVLASHPSLFGAGELRTLGLLAESVNLPPAGTPGWDARLLELRRLGQAYLDEVWKLAPNARYITDKMPGNYMYLGLLHLMLPQAKIIHAMRDPMDSCFSCYALRFQDGHEYCYDLATLGRYYLRYRELMQHWHEVLPPGRILDVRYEDTVADLEKQARRVLDYVGLPWDPACLNFHENKRAVSTASVTQVRRPIYKTSVARWKHFEKHLGPLIEIIRPAT
jgi:tetratricopeptide (TPR) repeat protein